MRRGYKGSIEVSVLYTASVFIILVRVGAVGVVYFGRGRSWGFFRGFNTGGLYF